MRLFLLLFCSFFSLIIQPAFAALEVRDIRIEARSAPGADVRDVAVAEATRQAITRVWEEIAPGSPLPELTAAELQSVTTYVDVTNETIQTNYYAGTFNIGLNRNALLRTMDAPATAPEPSAPKQWTLVVPVQRAGERFIIWRAAEAWPAAWLRARVAGEFMATAGGDAKDRKLLTEQMLLDSTDFSGPLLQLASKYAAPRVVMVTLESRSPVLAAGEEVEVLVDYYDMSGGPISRSASVYLRPEDSAAPVDQAVAEAQRLITEILAEVTADVPASNRPVQAANPPAVPGVTGSRPAQSATSYAGSVGRGEASLWVRMPLKDPKDVSAYRRKIGTIAGARFEMSAMTRDYIEGTIYYTGTQEALMTALAGVGLRPRP